MLTRSWRKVRGKRWRALRARLAALSTNAAANGAALPSSEAAVVEDGATAPLAAGHAPETEVRPVKH
jgi:hypothetical protein